MENLQQTDANDIAAEKYQGPGRAITSAGYMYVSHAVAMAAGFIGLGAIGLLSPNKTNAIKHWAEELSASTANSNIFKKGLAGTVKFVSEIAESAAHTIMGWGKKIAGNRLQGKSIGEEKAAAGLFAGGFGAALGYLGSTAWGILKGSHEGDKGKRQFERAQEAIKNLRKDNADLNKINDELHQKYREASTADAAPKATASEAPAPAITGLNAARHEGTLAAARTAEPAIA